MIRTQRKIRCAGHVVLVFLLASSTAFCVERFAVREIKEDFDWRRYARQETVLQISGRYSGRLSKLFQMDKLPVSLTPARTTVLPEDIESGQRLSVTGIVRNVSGRFVIEATRIVIGSSDIDRVLAAAGRLGDDDPEQVYALTEQYEPIADFYDDQPLKTELATIRSAAFNRQRIACAGDAAKLHALASRGASLHVRQPLLDAIRFESLIAESKSKSLVPEKFLLKIKEQLPGWDTTQPMSAEAELQFLKTPARAYDAADADLRAWMHRRLYRQVRLTEILKPVLKDGSNALQVSQKIAAELPEETEAIAALRKSYVDYRLERVPTLTRRQLQNLETLLPEFAREKEFRKAVDDWVKAQEKRLDNGQLDGVLRTAEEYLFVFERWKNPQHGGHGAELLKQAWNIANKVAPKEAEQIGQQLERFGLTRMHDRWMTTEEVSRLPRNDVQLAMREGRVVVGMHPEQIIGTLGEPAKRIRVISARRVQEIWVFGEDGSTTITVHLERLRSESPNESVAKLIAKSAN